MSPSGDGICWKCITVGFESCLEFLKKYVEFESSLEVLKKVLRRSVDIELLLVCPLLFWHPILMKFVRSACLGDPNPMGPDA
jgi:hypothetical protein